MLFSEGLLIVNLSVDVAMVQELNVSVLHLQKVSVGDLTVLIYNSITCEFRI